MRCRSNTWLMSGRLEPLHALVPIHTMRDPSSRSFFRLPIANVGIDNMVDSYWLEFVNQNVRVIRSPVTGQDDNGRYYWADGVYPKWMTGDMIKNANQMPPVVPYNPYQLGIPQPAGAAYCILIGRRAARSTRRAPTATPGSPAPGEEGPPAPPTLHTGKLDDVWHITVTAPTALDTANRNLTLTRIYRSVTGAQGVASYFMVVELPIATLTYDDTLTDAAITLNEELGSLDWYAPPVDLQGLVQHAERHGGRLAVQRGVVLRTLLSARLAAEVHDRGAQQHRLPGRAGPDVDYSDRRQSMVGDRDRAVGDGAGDHPAAGTLHVAPVGREHAQLRCSTVRPTD